MDPQNGSTRRVVMMMSSRDKSPERALTRKQSSKVVVGTVNKMRRVQVVYYLTRNGQLEHPHFMELSLLPNQHLRLKDIMDRLTALRGKGMPSLYSWSSKRNYKNGYVWNDLLENDVVLPTDGGAEYVLKGSEIVESSNATSESFRQLHLTRDNKSALSSARPRLGEYEDEYEEEEEEEKQSYDTSSTTPRSRCSRGVSTEEVEETHKSIAEMTLGGGGHESDHSPPPPSSASSNPSGGGGQGGGDGKKDEENIDLHVSSAILPSRNSLLLQLIACGGGSGSGVTMKKCARKNVIRKEVLTRNVMMRTRKLDEEVNNDEDRDMIRCMSENPRFGNFQAEEKEYFSGSIVESISSDQSALPQPLLKRSNSYHDQQQRTLKIGSDEDVEEEKREKAVKGKCIPLMKSCASKHF